MAMQDGPWAKYRQQTPQQVPGVIYGGPKPVEPAEAERLALARRADARAAEDQARQNRNDARGSIPAGYERKADGSIGPMAGYDPTKSGKPNEGEMKAAAFLTRALGANTSYENAGVGPRSLVGQTMADTVPGILNSLPGGVGNSPERQVSDSAQDEFIAASLRQDSGAAIPPAELDRQRRIYFPMPGDGPDVIAQKRAARYRAIAGLRESAGTALTDQQREVLKEFEPNIAAAVRGEALPTGGEYVLTFNDERRDATGKRYTQAQEAEIVRAIRDGDLGQVLALHQRFSGNKPDEAAINSARAAIDAVRKDPKTKIEIGYSAADAVAQAKEDRDKYGDYLPQAMKDRKDLVVDPVVRGVADIVPFMDEIAAVGNTVFGGGTYADNVRRERAIDEADARVNSRLRFAGQLGGAAIPVGRFLGFGRGGVARSAASYGAEGAGLGALYAAGKADPSPDSTASKAFGKRAAAAPAGAALGGATAYGLARVAQAIRSRGGDSSPPPGGEEAMDLAVAADAENVPISRPIVDPAARTPMAYLESSIGGARRVRNSLEDTRSGIEGAVQRMMGGGTAQEGGVMGQRIQEAGTRYVDRSRNVARRLYDRAAQMAGDNPVRPREAVRVIDEQIAELSGNANQNAPLVNYLREVRGDLVDETGNLRAKGIGDIRDIRTQLRGNINTRNLSATDAERRVGMVLDAARQDIQRDLALGAPSAVRQYERADRFWRERQAEIKQVVQKVIGRADDPIGGEAAWNRIRNMASPRGDSERLARMWSKLNPEEQADAAATIANAAGRASPEGDFTPGLFVRFADSLSPAARRTIFGDEGARSIANLRALSNALKDTSSALNNSRSGMVRNWSAFLKDLVSPGAGTVAGTVVGGVPGAAVGTAVGASITGAGAGIRNLSARALMSHDMSRWLKAAAGATSPTKVQKAIDALSVIARRDPAIAQDALGLQRHLQQTFAQTPLRAAASEEEKQ